MKKVKSFFKNVFGELKKVKWPTRKEMVKYTLSTIVFVLVMAASFYGLIRLMAYIKTVVKLWLV